MRKIDQIILNSAKMVYGVEKVKNGASVPFGYDVIPAWSIVGYDTLEKREGIKLKSKTPASPFCNTAKDTLKKNYNIKGIRDVL